MHIIRSSIRKNQSREDFNEILMAEILGGASPTYGFGNPSAKIFSVLKLFGKPYEHIISHNS